MIRLELNDTQVAELEQEFRHAADRKLRDRLQIVLMAHHRRPHGQIADDLGLNRRTVQRHLNAYRQHGLAGLRPRKACGPKPRIPESWRERVRQWVIAGPAACGVPIANWTYAELAQHLQRSGGIAVKKSAMAEFCHRCAIRPYRPTYRFLRGDPQKQVQARAEVAELKKGRKKAN